MKKIYEYEGEFINLFNEALEDIQFRAEENDPLTLREVLQYGFNSIKFDDTVGYEPADFTPEQLDKKVRVCDWNSWDEDADGYRRVYLEEVE